MTGPLDFSGGLAPVLNLLFGQILIRQLSG